MPRQPTQNLAETLLDWYDRHHRVLPWRVAPADAARGVKPDPYHVWLSEIMLQQTLVEAVKPYFSRFIEQWPTVEALSKAEPDDVMKAWAGLGYYSRARNLKKCADMIAADHAGRFPTLAAGLKALPGIGDYTAAAIAAIAFGENVPVVDGNVERVVARLTANDTPLPGAKLAIRDFVAACQSAARPGDFAQAMMDLGATVCTPRRPACFVCPLRSMCKAVIAGDPETLPVKAPKKHKPLRHGAAFVAVMPDGAVLLRRRPPSGLLGGMAEVPTTGWTARRDGTTDTSGAPFPAEWKPCGEIRHVFTHFELELTVYVARLAHDPVHWQGWRSGPENLPDEALPSVMKKVIEAALPGATRARKPDKEGA